MTAWVLIVMWYVGGAAYTGVSMQEFNTEKQCQYAVSLIKTRGHIDDAFCIKK